MLRRSPLTRKKPNPDSLTYEVPTERKRKYLDRKNRITKT